MRKEKCNMKENVSVADTAKVLGKSEQFVRIGLQRNLLPFGVAIKISSCRYSYHISPKLLREYIGDYQLDQEEEI